MARGLRTADCPTQAGLGGEQEPVAEGIARFAAALEGRLHLQQLAEEQQKTGRRQCMRCGSFDLITILSHTNRMSQFKISDALHLDEADEAHATNEAVVLDVAIEANTVDGANKAN